jgi:hypothetical protein
MSRINGDKARYNRKRKSKIARRARNEKRWKAEGIIKDGAATPVPAKPAR